MSMTEAGVTVRRPLGKVRQIMENRSLPGAPCVRPGPRGSTRTVAGGLRNSGASLAGREFEGRPVRASRADNTRAQEAHRGLMRRGYLTTGCGNKGARPRCKEPSAVKWVSEYRGDIGRCDQAGPRGGSEGCAEDQRGLFAPRIPVEPPRGARGFDFVSTGRSDLARAARAAAVARPGDFFLPRECPARFRHMEGADAAEWTAFFRAAGWDEANATRMATA